MCWYMENNKVEILTNEYGSKQHQVLFFTIIIKQSVVGEFGNATINQISKTNNLWEKRIIGRKLNTFENNFNFDLKIGKMVKKIFIELPTVVRLYPEKSGST